MVVVYYLQPVHEVIASRSDEAVEPQESSFRAPAFGASDLQFPSLGKMRLHVRSFRNPQ